MSEYFQSHYGFTYRPNRSLYQLKAKQLIQAIRTFDPKASLDSFLDLGCGCGDLMGAVHDRLKAEVAGIDQDPISIQRAQEAGKGTFLRGEVLNKLPLSEKRFQVVVSFELLEHLSHEQHSVVMSLYRQYAQKRGLGVIMVPNAAHPLLGGWLCWSDYTHRTAFTTESLAQLLRLHGIQEARIGPWVSAGSEGLLKIRKLFSHILEFLVLKIIALMGTAPKATDPFISNGFPLSSHLIAVFRLPE